MDKRNEASLCAFCGSPLREGARFCPECGYDTVLQKQSSENIEALAAMGASDSLPAVPEYGTASPAIYVPVEEQARERRVNPLPIILAALAVTVMAVAAIILLPRWLGHGGETDAAPRFINAEGGMRSSGLAVIGDEWLYYRDDAREGALCRRPLADDDTQPEQISSGEADCIGITNAGVVLWLSDGRLYRSIDGGEEQAADIPDKVACMAVSGERVYYIVGKKLRNTLYSCTVAADGTLGEPTETGIGDVTDLLLVGDDLFFIRKDYQLCRAEGSSYEVLYETDRGTRRLSCLGLHDGRLYFLDANLICSLDPNDPDALPEPVRDADGREIVCRTMTAARDCVYFLDENRSLFRLDREGNVDKSECPMRIKRFCVVGGYICAVDGSSTWVAPIDSE